MHFILFYEYVQDIAEKRGPYRGAHLEHLKQSFDAGEIVMAGALADPVDGALVIFRGASPEVAERFAKSDPYVLNSLVTAWRVRNWSTVVGDGASLPVS